MMKSHGTESYVESTLPETCFPDKTCSVWYFYIVEGNSSDHSNQGFFQGV